MLERALMLCDGELVRRRDLSFEEELTKLRLDLHRLVGTGVP